MSGIVAKWQSWGPQMGSVLRIMAAIMFMQFGAMKLFAFPVGVPPAGGAAAIMTQSWIGGVLEVFGGGLLALGLFTRPVAFILSGEMAVAYWQFHAPRGFWLVENQGGAAALFCFVWLYFSAAGPGPWSVDAHRNWK